MSLIEVQRFGNDVAIHSDTKVMDDLHAKSSPFRGALKAIIIEPRICICFAGKNYFAEEVLRTYYANNPLNFSLLITLILRKQIESEGSTDFGIVSFLSGQCVLYKISNGRVFNNIDSFYLGDELAHTFFQKNLTVLNQREKKPFSNFHKAFKKVVEADGIKYVGDYIISISADFSNRSPILLYDDRFFIDYTQSPIALKDMDNVKRTKDGRASVVLGIGSARMGSYPICYLASRSFNNHAVGIYFPLGEFGILFYPKLLLLYSEKIISKSGKGFINQIWQKYSVKLSGMIPNESGGMLRVNGPNDDFNSNKEKISII